VKDLSSYLGVSPCTVYRWVENQEIPFVRRNGLGIRFRREAIEGWLIQGSAKQNPVLEGLLNVDLSLEAYDKLFLKGGVKMSPKGKTWNYPFGSVYLRLTKSGQERWYIYYRFDGKRVRKAVKGSQTRGDALKVLQVEVADAFRGKHGFTGTYEPVIFEKFSVDFIEKYSKLNKRKNSVRSDENGLQNLNAFFGKKALSAITPQLVEGYKAMRKLNVSNASVNREISLLKTILNTAVLWEIIPKNLIAGKRVKRLEEPNRRMRILTPEEASRLIDGADKGLQPFLIIALQTGMRRNEILSLGWKDIDFASHEIRVDAETSKSRKERFVPMNPLVEAVLFARPKTSPQFVFHNKATGSYIKDIKTAFGTACRKARIKGFRVHDLRHTAATWMVEDGVDIVTIKEILGHASLETTQRYCHPNKEAKRRASMRLAERLKPTKMDILEDKQALEGVVGIHSAGLN
jgi:excisionase family DNA binding protein